MKKIVAILAGFLLSSPAMAAVFAVDFNFATGSGPTDAHLTITTEDTLNGVFGYNVTAIEGDVDGDIISGIIANPGAPNASNSADGLWYFDNNFDPNGSPLLTSAGLYFASLTKQYNLWGDGPGAYTLGVAASGTYTTPTNSFSAGSIGVTPIPEPAIWLTLLAGMAAVGGSLRRRPKDHRRPFRAA